MREILFKAKRSDNGEWVKGYVFDNGETRPEMRKFFVGGLDISKYKGTACDEWSIDGTYFYEVDPETICQFIGLTDSDGEEVFDGDILNFSVDNADFKWSGYIEFGNPNRGYTWGWQLVWMSGCRCNTDTLLWFDMEESGVRSEVVGNIHDKEE